MWTCLIRSAVLVLLATSAGCREPAQESQASQQVPESLPLFGDNEPLPNLCRGAVTADLGLTISVRVFAAASVDRKRVRRHAHALESVAASWGVRFRQAGELAGIDEEPLFVAVDRDAARALAEAESKDASLSAAQREAILAPFVTAPLRRVFERLTPQSETEVQLFFVDRIADPASPISAGLRHPAGLTFSPFAPKLAQEPNLAALIGIDQNSLQAPVIFLSLRELTRIPPEKRNTVLAHEFGHAFGLAHGGGRENLMEPTRHARCSPGLNADQLRVLQSNLVPSGVSK